MQKQESFELRVWQYLDGELSREEEEVLKSECQLDFEKRAIFDQCQILHQELDVVHVQKAPKGILEAVIVKVNDIKILERSAVRSILSTVIIMVIIGIGSMFIPEGEESFLTLMPLDKLDQVFSTFTFSLICWTSCTIFIYLWLDHIYFRPRVPK